jgi:hypothetical protein
VLSGTNSQRSKACAIVVINSKPMHSEAHEASSLRDAADRHWLLFIGREISQMPNQAQFLEMYHYPIQNGMPDLILAQEGELIQHLGKPNPESAMMLLTRAFEVLRPEPAGVAATLKAPAGHFECTGEFKQTVDQSRDSDQIFARADAGFYCWEAVQPHEKGQASFIIVARKTKRLLAELQSARWQSSPRTDADEQCEFWYQPEGWGKPYRFVALRYQKKDPLSPEREQYQLFDSPQYIYRVFVTDMQRPLDLLVWFYKQRAAAENLIKEANNDAGLAAHPSGRWGHQLPFI